MLNTLKSKRDGDKILKLYERALNTANKYLPIKLGPGNAKIASAMLNEILSEDVLRGNGVELFRSENKQLIEQRARQVMTEDLTLREVMGKTLWVKWLLDKSFNRTASVATLENGWAYQIYSREYPMPTLEEYESIVTDFEKKAVSELGKYLMEHSR